MAALPTTAQLTGNTVTKGQFKTRLGELRDFLSGLLGTDGVPATARAALGFPATCEPINVNPNFLLDQINEGALYTVSGGTTQGPDGWTGNASGAGVFKMRQLAAPWNAAEKCMEITCTTADAAIAASDRYDVYTMIEGYDLASLKPGTADASQITVMFSFKTNVTGVYSLAFRNSASNRSYIGSFTVSDTDKHDYSVTLTLDTTGTWLYTNGNGCQIHLTLAAGTDWQNTADTWAAANDIAVATQCNFMSANTNVAYLGRFHVIPGGVALAYANNDIQKELAKAQRYYWKSFPQGTAVAQNVGNTLGCLECTIQVNSQLGVAYVPHQFRSAPTVTTYNPSAANTNWNGGETASAVSIGSSGFGVQASGATSASTRPLVHVTANARLS